MERPIEASTLVSVPLDRVGRLLQDDPTVVLPNPTAIIIAGVCRDVVVTLDDALADGERIIVPLSWHAAEHPKLFPTFLGELIADAWLAGTRLTMAGTYWVPLGVIGRFGDGLIGRRLAHEALRDVVAGAAARIEIALDGDVLHAQDRDITVVESTSIPLAT